MTTTRLVRLTDEHAELVTAALRSASSTRQRAATRAAAELDADGDVTDKRPGSVRIARMLAEAAALDQAASDLDDGPRLEAAEELSALSGVDVDTSRADLLEVAVGDALADAGVLAPDLLVRAVRSTDADAWRELLEAVRVATIDRYDEHDDAAAEATAVARARAAGVTSSLDEDDPVDPIATTTEER